MLVQAAGLLSAAATAESDVYDFIESGLLQYQWTLCITLFELSLLFSFSFSFSFLLFRIVSLSVFAPMM
jgi:hypothetical protein